MVAISNPERKSGISILGDVPWGTHLCYFYQTKQDLIDILVPFFKTGLENNEFCMWIVSEPLTVEEARAELQRAVKELDRYDKKGQIEILHFSQWYTRTGKFDADKVLRGWADKEQQARRNGFEGLRVSGSALWTEQEERRSLSDYEATVNNVIHNYHILAICSYSLDKCEPHEILNVFSTHQLALIFRDGKWATIESTERKRAEEALRQSERRYKSFISHSHEGVWRVELEQPIPIDLPAEEGLGRFMQDAHIAECNLAYARMFGLSSPEEMVGKRLRDLGSFSDQGSLESYRASARGGFRTVDFQGLDKAGNLKYFQSTEIPIVENGMLVHIWGTTRDVSELKRADEERRRSFDQLRALAARLQSIREEERKRVAREIHDQLGRALTAIKIDMSSLVLELRAGEKQHSQRTSSILRLVDESIQAVRRISTELRPGMLDDVGLVGTIEWAGEDFQARTGTTCRLDLPQDDIVVDAERATAIFRIFQETLTNVARHADASEVKVRLAKEGHELTLEVRDNGKGIPEDKLSGSESLGILGMRERAILLGGELTISSTPGTGTTVRVRIPEAGQNQPE